MFWCFSLEKVFPACVSLTYNFFPCFFLPVALNPGHAFNMKLFTGLIVRSGKKNPSFSKAWLGSGAPGPQPQLAVVCVGALGSWRCLLVSYSESVLPRSRLCLLQGLPSQALWRPSRPDQTLFLALQKSVL